MAQVPGLLAPTWQDDIPGPAFSLALTKPLWPFAKESSVWHPLGGVRTTEIH